MTVKEAFKELQVKMNNKPEGIQKLRAIYQFNLEESGIFQFVFQEGKVEMLEGDNGNPDCILQLSDENMLKMLEGNFNTTMAYMTGKLKIKGDLGLALKLQAALEQYR
ncbi:SCP2 sterol-binding domain-containing protein [Sutcliffiella halmapala]|uniref:SCP2 sterol-binding domain-containing protein n=1 Tax=Sutcliffiella halmapala TaxID=79882 RepID=UPI00099546C5|nr:SCP2 sterol-binding domain-containing protein [Sutcliffiella halmapala]